MSGDVQPRKRKDKKKRKDGEDEHHAAPRSSVSLSDNDDVNIHVHKDGGTGGGICAKFVFFVLLTALAVLIGLIVTEHRGLTHLDTIEKESRFSQLFEGWVDTAPEDHGDHEVPDLHDENELDHDDDHDEEHDDEHDDDHDDDHDEDHEDDDHDEDHDDEEESEEADIKEDDEVEDHEEGSEQVAQSEELDHADATDEEEAAEDQPDEVENEDDNDDEADKDESAQEETIPESNEDNEPKSEELNISEEERQEKEEGASPENADDVDQENDDPDAKDDDAGENSENEELSIGADKRSGEQNLGDYGTWESTPNSYYEDIPQSQEDFEATEQLTDAENQMNVNAALALNIFNQVLTKYPESVRGLYGKAQCLDRLAEQKRSNSLLMEAIQAYWHIINQKNVPNNLFIATGERCIDRMRFIGHYSRAVDVHKLLIDRYPRNVTLRNQLAVTYLTINRINEARALLQKTLDLWPNDGFALVHYGFILKVNDNDLNGAIKYLTKGLETKEAGVVDGRFYFHLGDALTRLGRRQEADAVYTQGVEMGVFLSKYQRSLYNVNRLTSRAWWSKDQMGHYKRFCDLLEENYEAVREEGLQALNGLGKFQDESENLRDSGDWKQFELYARGQRNAQNCKRCPFTCKLVESFPDAVGCRRGQIKFSVMHPGTHVWPHCGPTNCRLRIHLGLKVPKNTFIRVADDVTSWTEGRVLIFDDSFEHEVWHNGSDFRLVLIVDVWHPELTVSEKRTLSAI